MNLRWERVAWDRRYGTIRIVPKQYDQFDRNDESFLRRDESIGNYRVVLIQVNQYRQRSKLFLVEVWSADNDLDAAIVKFEEITQAAGELRFEQLISVYGPEPVARNIH